MKEINASELEQVANQSLVFIFIHTPFCGTCKLARKMLMTLEEVGEDYHFFELNGSLAPSFLHEHKIKSVPCLMVIDKGEVKEKLYSFESVTKIFEHLSHYIN